MNEDQTPSASPGPAAEREALTDERVREAIRKGDEDLAAGRFTTSRAWNRNDRCRGCGQRPREHASVRVDGKNGVTINVCPTAVYRG